MTESRMYVPATIRGRWTLGCIVLITVGIAGCATPQAIKDGSKHQLELLNAMNQAAIGLRQGLDDFHSQQTKTIEDWARVQTATDAIDAAVRSQYIKVTPDSLFQTDESRIRPLIYGVTRNFETEAQRLSELQKQAESQGAAAKDDETRQTLQLMALGLSQSNDRITREKADWTIALNASGCGDPCSNVHSQAVGLVADETNTAARIDGDIQILQAQIAIMSQIASAIDQWLSIDITISQAQASQLDTTYQNAISSLGKGK